MKNKGTFQTEDIYSKITNLFIEKIESGVAPWYKNWSIPGVLPQNYFNKNTYHGINLFLLSMTPYSIPYFCTFNQAKANGGMIRKGAKALPVAYWNTTESKTETVQRPDGSHEPKKNSFVKYYNVFNICDVEGIDFVFPELVMTANERISVCETLVANMPQAPAIRHQDPSGAYYVPNSDYINMPTLEQFISSADYYSVLFHELTHSTGHVSRLNREGVCGYSPMGSVKYSKEELVAELGAAFLAQFSGIDNADLFENSASYLKGWLTVLKNDKKFIFLAAREAQKAVEFIMPDLAALQTTAED